MDRNIFGSIFSSDLQKQIEQQQQFAECAQLTYSLFSQYMSAGFSEEQALELLKVSLNVKNN